jgi:Zn-dependent peptidase ImmA (M78 family)/transcriptional regulator with XRE-family HTH domain
VAVDIRDSLAIVFGEASRGDTAEERARTSNREFVRSQDHLALANSKSTGHRITAWEALNAFGITKLEEAIEYGSAVLSSEANEPAQTLRKFREDRGLEKADLAHALKATSSQVESAEDPKTVNPIEFLERVAIILGVDEAQLSVRPASDVDDKLGIRLRRIKEANPAFTPSTVIAFDEAAWVIHKQISLSSWLEGRPSLTAMGFEADSRYGERLYPAWQVGYDLAHAARANIGLSTDEPILSLREIVEKKLKIPLIHLSLSPQFAGATIATGSSRGIAVNVNGLNQNEWVRRATIAHELGHLLWDPDEELKSVVVDTFDTIEGQPPQLRPDFVEARANAFAIEFLAPRDSALQIFESHDDKAAALREVMVHFGVSFTSAKFQIWNATERSIPLESFSVHDVEPTDDWKGRESYTVDFFKPREVPISRRGRFAWYVLNAMRKKFVSEQSAALFLNCPIGIIKEHEAQILSLY